MDGRILDRLYDTIEARRGADPKSSWTAELLAGAPALPAKKLGEEAAEVIIEAMRPDPAGVTREAADLVYHLLVVLAASGVTPAELWAELDRRASQSGRAEKAGR